MKAKSQLQLQAYLDGELTPNEARGVESWLDLDPEARGLIAELRNTRAALMHADSDVKLPESREFYWSKIKRDIERLERNEPAPSRQSNWLAGWRRLLAPVGVVAALALVLVASLQTDPAGTGSSVDVQVTLEDASAVTFRDEVHRTTLVWFTYPAEKPSSAGGVRETLKRR